VVDASGEIDLWRLERVVCGEVDREEEDAASIWGVAWTHYCGLPVELLLEVSKAMDMECGLCASSRQKIVTCTLTKG